MCAFISVFLILRKLEIGSKEEGKEERKTKKIEGKDRCRKKTGRKRKQEETKEENTLKEPFQKDLNSKKPGKETDI